MTIRFNTALAAGALALAAFAGSAGSASVLSTETFHFTGDCGENAACTGEAHAALTLTGYTYGDSFSTDNFVSFSFTSNAVSYTIDNPATLDSEYGFYGQFSTFFIWPNNTVAVHGLDTEGVDRSFYSFTGDGLGWDTYETGDFGFYHEWDATPPAEDDPTGDVPEPASWAMMLAGFGLTGAAMRRRRVAVRFA